MKVLKHCQQGVQDSRANYKYGSIKPRFTIDKYSIDKPINIYSDRHIFKHNA